MSMRALNHLWPLARASMRLLGAEKTHDMMLDALDGPWGPSIARACTDLPPSHMAREIAGMHFPSPVGIAAGLDKDGRGVKFWPSIGVGFMELGSVTLHPQAGSPKPRLHRVPGRKALINTMGFNNLGAAAMADRLSRLRDEGWESPVPIGVSIGKSKQVFLSDAHEDYAGSVRLLKGLPSYYAINLSSPNTEGLRSLQRVGSIERILSECSAADPDTPMFVKISPDLDAVPMRDVIRASRDAGARGIIAVNTSTRRDLLPRKVWGDWPVGGLSGEPLYSTALSRISEIVDQVRGKMAVIGVGGISNARQAQRMLDKGCDAVQLYTAIAYQGPGIIGRINRGLLPQ